MPYGEGGLRGGGERILTEIKELEPTVHVSEFSWPVLPFRFTPLKPLSVEKRWFCQGHGQGHGHGHGYGLVGSFTEVLFGGEFPPKQQHNAAQRSTTQRILALESMVAAQLLLSAYPQQSSTAVFRIEDRVVVWKCLHLLYSQPIDDACSQRRVYVSCPMWL